MLIRKHGIKLFFVAVLLLSAISLVLSAYSYARYVTSEHTGMDGVGTAGIDCKVIVNDGGGNHSFVNAPFVQKISDTTQPVQMNSWAEAQVTVRNDSPKDGLRYEYSFVMYLPEGFAERAMFQLVELKRPEDARDEEDPGARLADAKKASEIYSLNTTTLKLEKVETTNQGISIDNDYRLLINDGKELKIDTQDQCAILEDTTRSVTEKRTFSTRYTENGALNIVAPIYVTQNVDVRFYRITVNLSYTQDPNEYILNAGGDYKTFIFRLVLKESLDSSEFTGATFDPSVFWETVKDADGNVIEYVKPLDGDAGLPQIDEKYECRWAAEKQDGVPVLQVKAKTDPDTEWKSVTFSCVGFTSPARIAAVFTQCDGLSA